LITREFHRFGIRLKEPVAFQEQEITNFLHLFIDIFLLEPIHADTQI
jgi:hypothetical protein